MAARRTRFALLDPVTPAAGLFRCDSKIKSSSRHHPTCVRLEHGGWDVELSCQYALGADDWRILVTLVALAGLDGERVDPEDTARQAGLSLAGDAVREPTLTVTTTAYAVLREAGLSDNGPNRRALSRSLDRLLTVLQRVTKKGSDKGLSGCHLLSYEHDDQGRLVVTLAPGLVRALLGTATQYARVSLVEVRAIGRNAPALVLHAYLSSRVRLGAQFVFTLDTLVRAVYPAGAGGPATLRQHRRRVRAALKALPPTWSITAAGKRVTVVRTALASLVQWEERTEAAAEAVAYPRSAPLKPRDLPFEKPLH